MGHATKHGLMAVTEEIANALLDGDDSYGSYLAYKYYYNLVASTKLKSAVAYKICHVLESNIGPFDEFEVDGRKFPTKKPKVNDKTKEKLSYPENATPGKDKVLKEDWDHVLAYFKSKLKKLEADGIPEKTTEFRNIDLLAEALYLSETEKDILTFLHVAQNDEVISEFASAIIDKDPGRMVPLLSRFLGKASDVGKIAQAMHAKSPLISNGIIIADDFSDLSNAGDHPFPEITDNIQEMLPLINLDHESITENMLGKPAEAKLSTSNFSYLASDIEKIKTIIRNAVEKGEVGINILLYGPAGSGKTELSKAIAAELGLDLFSIGEDDGSDEYEIGKEPSSAKHRIGKLFQAHSFLKGKKNAILLFDEVEDLLNKGTDAEKKADTFSKIVVNRLLETNPVVTIWAGNDPDKFHESLRQRYSLSLYVDYPPVPMRAQIWRKQLELNRVELPEEDIKLLARRYQAPARLIANAIRMASLSDLTVENIEGTLKSSSRITYGHADEIESNGGVSSKFKRSLLNYDPAKQNYIRALWAKGPPRAPYALFIQGPAGSGIKSFGRFLAERNEMNPVEMDMRQLLTPSPLSSPQANIRNAFVVASDMRGLLVLSNMDALCDNPDGKAADWKADGLAEIFAQAIARHRLPVVVSTYKDKLELPGFMKDVFSLDLRLSFLTPDLCKKSYEVYFGHKPEGEIIFPTGLVPADFARVGHMLKKDLNGGATPAKIIAMLQNQVANRQEDQRRMGFASP